MALARNGLQVANEIFHIVHIIVQVKFAIIQRHIAGVFPVGNEHVMPLQHGSHRIAQKRGVMAGQRRHNQNHGLFLDFLQQSGVIGETLEMAQLAKWLVHFHLLVNHGLRAINGDFVQIEFRLSIILAQAVQQRISG